MSFFTGSLFFNSHVFHRSRDVPKNHVDKLLFNSASIGFQIPIVLELKKKNNLPLDLLVWALAMGSCLGGRLPPI